MGVRRHCCGRGFVAFGVVAVGSIIICWLVRVGCPAEALADAGGVEDEVFGDHAVVVGAERGDA